MHFSFCNSLFILCAFWQVKIPKKSRGKSVYFLACAPKSDGRRRRAAHHTSLCFVNAATAGSLAPSASNLKISSLGSGAVRGEAAGMCGRPVRWRFTWWQVNPEEMTESSRGACVYLTMSKGSSSINKEGGRGHIYRQVTLSAYIIFRIIIRIACICESNEG